MRFLKKIFFIFFLNVLLSACSVGSGLIAQQGIDYFPGGSPDYAWGISQRKETFINIERAQSYPGLYLKEQFWQDICINSRASARILGLHSYYPLSVRWRLKDGREFFLGDIDIRKIMREYFKENKIRLPWQLEGRPKAKFGDAGPLLTHEVKDDAILIKWVITSNLTPVDQRLTPKGAATPWVTVDKEYLVVTLKGLPTSGINFDKRYEVK